MNAMDPSLLGLTLEMIVKSCLILAGVLILTWYMRRYSAAARHLCLAAAAVSLLALPVASTLLPSWRILSVPQPLVSAWDSLTGAPAGPQSTTAPERGTSRLDAPPTAADAASRHAEANDRDLWPSWVFLVWIVGGAVLLLRLTGGKIYGYRIISGAPVLEDRRLLAAVRRVADQFGITRLPAVHESDHLQVPFVWGLLRPRLILPTGARNWPSERVEAVIRHELAHVKRRDLLVQFLAQISCCLYWVIPLVWVMERRMFIERERACDDLAIGRETRASDYAGVLMAVAEELGATRPRIWVVSAMAEGTDFKDRIVSVLDPAAKRTAPKAGHTATVVAVSALLVLSLSSLRPLSGTTQGAQTKTPPADDELLVAELVSQPDPVKPARGSRADHLLAALKMSDAKSRRHAAEDLGKLGDPRTVPALVAALGDEDPSVREHVATALGLIGDAAAEAPLRQVLMADPVARVREHAASALGMVGKDNETYRLLVETYGSDSEIRVRAHAAQGLGLMGDDRAFGLLVDGLKNRHPEIRSHCAAGLGFLGNPQAVSHLEGALNDRDSSVRDSAERALGLLREGR